MENAKYLCHHAIVLKHDEIGKPLDTSSSEFVLHAPVRHRAKFDGIELSVDGAAKAVAQIDRDFVIPSRGGLAVVRNQRMKSKWISH